jgi:hypothetical protein
MFDCSCDLEQILGHPSVCVPVLTNCPFVSVARLFLYAGELSAYAVCTFVVFSGAVSYIDDMVLKDSFLPASVHGIQFVIW